MWRPRQKHFASSAQRGQRELALSQGGNSSPAGSGDRSIDQFKKSQSGIEGSTMKIMTKELASPSISDFMSEQFAAVCKDFILRLLDIVKL